MSKNENIAWAALIVLGLPLMALCTNPFLVGFGIALIGTSGGICLSNIIRYYSERENNV